MVKENIMKPEVLHNSVYVECTKFAMGQCGGLLPELSQWSLMLSTELYTSQG